MAMKKVSAQRGFTLIELVTILIIVGILAVFVIGRLTTSTFSQRAFNDKVLSSIEYARKYGVAHRRYVCVRATTTGITFTLDTALPESGSVNKCNGTSEQALPMAVPDTNCASTNAVCVPSSSFSLKPSTPTLIFDATGANTTTLPPTAVIFQVNGPSSTTTTVTVEPVTGYVH